MAARKDSARPLVGGVGISSHQRVIDEASGTTKLALAEYYLAVADWLVPQLAGRPLSIVRAPEGIGGERFFQRFGSWSVFIGRFFGPIRAVIPLVADGQRVAAGQPLCRADLEILEAQASSTLSPVVITVCPEGTAINLGTAHATAGSTPLARLTAT